MLNHNPVIDTNGNGEIEVNEALLVTELSVSSGGLSDAEKISDLTGLEEFVNLIELYIGNNLITSFDFSFLSNLEILSMANNGFTSIDLSQNTLLTRLLCGQNLFQELDLSSNLELKELYLGSSYDMPLSILNLPNNLFLEHVEIWGTNITSLDLSNNSLIDLLIIVGTDITTLDLSGNIDLEGVQIDNNPQMTQIDFLNNPLLDTLFIRDNPQLTDVNLSCATNLRIIHGGFNNISNIDLSQNTELLFLDLDDNPISSIDLSNNYFLSTIRLKNSALSTLDLSQNENLRFVYITDNYSLENVNLANGNNSLLLTSGITRLWTFRCVNLQTICVDDIGFAETNFRDYVEPQTIFVENCSITDVNYNLISGVVTFDEDNNGCDNALDHNIPNVLITANDGTNEYGTFTNSNGGYVIDVPTGTYTTEVNGLFEQYTVDPVSGSSSFVNLGETDTQDFCFTANQVFYDVEAVLLPLTVARPGFDATYQLVYKNNGLSITNGSIIFEFNDMQQTFVSSSQVPDVNNVNSLSFNYSNLQPFETRTIDITLNTFSPPTVNGDDILNLTASIQPTDSDVAPENNVYTLEQVVVNSYDPNDKQVLQGAEITMEQANEYLDYLIRFQNTGTASAINVAITDQLSNDLDWSTIQPLSSSHDYYARITNGNFVEFIFDNINLPAEQDDAEGSNGFVAFRIKPKSDVVVGDVITGLANIYFDFNAPIITNTVSTEIVEPLSLNDYSIENQVTLYPNPTSGLLNLVCKIGLLKTIILIKKLENFFCKI